MKLTKAQINLLRRVEDSDQASLMNGDEHDPQWWIDGDRAAPKRTAEALVNKGMVVFCARWGGHPGTPGAAPPPARVQSPGVHPHIPEGAADVYCYT